MAGATIRQFLFEPGLERMLVRRETFTAAPMLVEGGGAPTDETSCILEDLQDEKHYRIRQVIQRNNERRAATDGQRRLPSSASHTTARGVETAASS